MKIARLRLGDRTRLGVIVGDEVRIAPLTLPYYDDTPLLLKNAAALEVLERLATNGSGAESLPVTGVELLSPVMRPGKIVGIGLNYGIHVEETKFDRPKEPLIFAKFPSSIIGPNDPIRWDPALTDAVDFEAELGVVIGTPARNVPVDRALDYVFGYTCLNDVSARDLQFGDGQWVRSKSLDRFCPMGPLIQTADEVPDPGRLGITCTVSGVLLQDATTADLLFSVPELISRLSRSFTLEPGDVIATGTPPGTGWFRDPRRLLRDGDEVLVSIEGIGQLRNPVVLAQAVA
jgi:2-keto-4-pentenoate hydratase/2-oxohepta-3-ene-1,7-dioic acid hydratase in catechol pathway